MTLSKFDVFKHDAHF